MLISCITLFLYLTIFDTLSLLWTFNFSIILLIKMNFFFYDGYFLSDYLSFSMMFISLWVFILSLMSMTLSNTSKLILWVMMVATLTSFLFYSGMVFYMLFEFCFVLMFIFLIGWGMSMERIQASFYMFFYTLVFSLPLLILILEETVWTTMNYFLFFTSHNFSFLWIFMILVFVVKLPLFSFHLWLPKAHVEAPIAGSMILAGVLLKLGGFGLIRFYSMIESFSMKNSILINYLVMISILGGVYMNCVCLRQTDLKMLIAYSSVVHMSLVYVSAVSFSVSGHLGCVLMMLAHGFISPSLFYLMTMLYNNSFTRSMYFLKGSFSLTPTLTLFWFLACSLNFGFPPFMSFSSEILIMMSLSFFNLLMISFLLIFFLLTGVYCIFMYISVVHGDSVFNNTMKPSLLNSLLNTVLTFFIITHPLNFFIT